jgi:hypothetical protein
MVGVRGLEPLTPAPPEQCATKLRHTPSFLTFHSPNTVCINWAIPTTSDEQNVDFVLPARRCSYSVPGLEPESPLIGCHKPLDYTPASLARLCLLARRYQTLMFRIKQNILLVAQRTGFEPASEHFFALRLERPVTLPICPPLSGSLHDLQPAG